MSIVRLVLAFVFLLPLTGCVRFLNFGDTNEILLAGILALNVAILLFLLWMWKQTKQTKQANKLLTADKTKDQKKYPKITGT